MKEERKWEGKKERKEVQAGGFADGKFSFSDGACVWCMWLSDSGSGFGKIVKCQTDLQKKCQKGLHNDNFAKIDPVFMLVPSKFRYFLATDWQRSCNIRWIKSYFYNIKTLLMNCFQNWKEQSVRFFSFKINWFGNIAYQESLFGCSVGFGYRLNCWWS